MASTSQSAVLHEINALFSWNPPLLKLSKPESNATRLPSFFDRHFSPQLILKRVVGLPSLVQDLATAADEALEAAKDTLPDETSFMTAQYRKIILKTLETTISQELAVATFYALTTGAFCPFVASTLALHPTASFSEWTPLLHFRTRSVSSSGYAIGELTFLTIDTSTTDGQLRQEIVETMETNKRRVYEEMRDSKSPLTTHEVKSLTAGSVEVMKAVTTLDDFSWTYCIQSKCTDIKHAKKKDMVGQVVLGPDALDPPWDISASKTRYEKTRYKQITRARGPAPLLASPPGPSTQEGHDDEDPYAAQRGTEPATMANPSFAPLSSAFEFPSSQPTSKKRKRTDDNAAYEHTHPPPSATSTSSPLTPLLSHEPCLKDKGKKRQKNDGDGDGNGDNNDDPTYRDRHDIPATSLVQQAWAQAVRVDTSIIVLHSGNHELVCIRHRASQMLYVSDVIEPHSCTDPGYGKLHVGIGIAAFQDAVDRKQQQMSKKTPADSLPSTTPARCPTPPFSPPSRTYKQDECLTIVATSEIGRGATGVALRGSLTPDNLDGATPLDVVVKLAFDSGQRDSLRDEYEVYLHLRSKGVHQGITTVLGFFNDLDGSSCALVMLYAGAPISTDSENDLTITECDLALSTLGSIHNAGILHGDIRPENVLINDLGVTIIDFGHATWCHNQKAKDEEYVYFQSILVLVGESTR